MWMPKIPRSVVGAVSISKRRLEFPVSQGVDPCIRDL
jgi:hypothetical protein